MPRRSLLEYLDLFYRWGAQTAYIERPGYRTVCSSYAEIADFASRFAGELHAKGIGKGDRVLLWAPNSAAWVTAFMGCVACGAVVVPIDDIATADFAHRVYQQVSAKLLVCSR